MTITSQPGGGNACYRQMPDDPCTVQKQTRPGARWHIVAVFVTADDAQRWVLRVTRGEEDAAIA